MKVTNVRSCSCCKTIGKIISSNNPIHPGICQDCLNKNINIYDIHQADFFCRTYNIPFNPDTWMRIVKQAGPEVFEHYVQVIMDEYSGNPRYTAVDDNGTIWDEVNKAWKRALEHENLLLSLESIKEDWIKQMNIKWGPNYTFTEYIKLENLYNNTIKGTGTTNTLTKNIISKIATISVLMDRSLENGEIKEAGEYSKMLRDQIKTAGLEDSVDVTESDVINTVSDLCNYLEQKGFQFDFYDGEKRDIVDMTIADIKEWTVNYVRDATGIQQTYTMIEDAYKASLEQNKTDLATSKVSLDDIINAKKQGLNEEVDGALDQEEWDMDDFDELEY